MHSKFAHTEEPYTPERSFKLQKQFDSNIDIHINGQKYALKMDQMPGFDIEHNYHGQDMHKMIPQNSSFIEKFRMLTQKYGMGSEIDHSLSRSQTSFNQMDHMQAYKVPNRIEYSSNQNYYNAEDYDETELEMETEDLVIIFTSCQQLFMVCFLVLCLILFCMKTPAGNCMIYTFSISNLINSFIYILVIFFLFLVILISEFVGNDPDTNDVISFSLTFVILFVAYGFNIFWSFLLLKVGKDLIPVKNADENTALTQENYA